MPPLLPFAVALLLSSPTGPTAPPAVRDDSVVRSLRPPLRGFSADRPDVTESPYTVPAGHVQVEASFVEYERATEADGHTHAIAVFPTNLKLGLTRTRDIQLIVSPYLRRSAGGGAAGSVGGVGDLTARAKVNLAGNDGGRVAVALLPFVRLPMGAADVTAGRVEAGLILPVAVRDLPGGFELGTMAEFDVDRDTRDVRFGLDVVHSLTVGHALIGDRASGYLEYVGSTGIRTGRGYAVSVDGGHLRGAAHRAV